MNRQHIGILLGVIVSVIFLVLAFRGLRPEALFASLANVNALLVLLATVVYFCAVTLISWRWQFLLTPVRRIPLFRLIQLVCIGYMGNNIYPLRAGEALRIFLLKRDEGVPVFRSTTVTIVERIFDGIVMLTFILVGVTTTDIQSDVVQTVAQVTTPIFAFGLIVFFTFALFPKQALKFVERVTVILPMRLQTIVNHLAAEVLSGLAALQNIGQLLGAIFASYASWMVEALIYWLVMMAFGFDLPYTAALLVVGTVNLAGLIPASPGQIGVYEFFASSAMVGFGITQDRALSYAIVVHIVIWLPVTLVGFAFLVRRGLGWGALATSGTLKESS